MTSSYILLMTLGYYIFGLKPMDDFHLENGLQSAPIDIMMFLPSVLGMQATDTQSHPYRIMPYW